MKKNVLLLLMLMCCTCMLSYAQYIGLENSVPAGWSTSSGSSLTMSDAHYKLGSQSVKWDWNQGAELNISNPPNINTAVTTYKGGLMLWVYNETPVDRTIRFEFGKGSSVDYYFDYGINFKGWRACWIRFKEDMSGPKSNQSLDYMKIIAPSDVESGSLCFDRMMFPSTRIHDRVTPDKQLPYINPSMNHNHWAALWYWYDNYTHDIALASSVSTEEQKAFDAIKKEMVLAYQGTQPTASKVTTVKDKFRSFDIQRLDGQITGRPYVSDDEYDQSIGDVKMDQVGPVLKDLAQIYFHNKDDEAKQMFYDLLDYVMDQGLNVGSGMGTNHHYGYNFREFPPAVFLMRDALKADGRLGEAVAMMNYWTGIQEYRIEPEVGTLQGLMDSWNTTVIPRLIAVISMDDSPEKAREMKAIKRWMDISLKIVPGTMGGIKEDGCGFHHGGLYPAYSKGGYAGVGTYLRFVNGTCYALSDEARRNFGKGIMAMRNYSNLLDWGFGICGRHPLAGTISSGMKNAYAYLAKSGNPDTGEDIWTEMAQAYMRLESSNTAFKKEFAGMGISAEVAPSGNFTYNYGALGIHRRDNWMVSVKGYNKHVWGSEIYSKDNRYGRYQSYGTVQVIGSGDPVKSSKSGFVENGWDWNRYPGATSIHLPLNLLNSPNSGTLMEKSNEGFTGASNLSGENGIFGMKLREKDRTNFTADHQANKSVFCFENRIICLGSDISNSNSQYPTETTLFQVNLADQSTAMYVDGSNAITSFPLQQDFNADKNHWLVDPVGNAYWLKSGTNLKISRATQDSRHNKTKAATQGDFASAWIDHGTSPSNQTYEYVILPQADVAAMEAFAANMNQAETAAYKVLKQDQNAHIVWDRTTNTTGYVFFDANSELSDEFVKQINASALVMLQANADQDKLNMSVCDPDLHIPEIAYTTAKASQESAIVICLKGNWEIDGQFSDVSILSRTNTETQMQFNVKDGIPKEVKLTKGEEITDAVAPIIKHIHVKDIQGTSAGLELTSNENGTLYWYVNLAANAKPLAEQVMNGAGSVQFGQNACVANEMWEGQMNDLQENESYVLHAVAEDEAGNVSVLSSTDSFNTVVTGVEDIDAGKDLLVYGKDGKIVIKSSRPFPSDTMVQVYDLGGRVLKSVLHSDSKELSVDVPNAIGIYIVRLQMDGQLLSKKLILKK
ncbi:chondroitinase family polysaccharide lyase [Marinifilum flexuosum]|uniref:chondroitinase family polysaccharide lyase n=1 Tax=Marinifilum flexuosum TaxID=1117708 RepID=UPI0024951BE4|nr:chondroitinase family polysaccharide lyase [Marinifilum flexuosum]